MKITFLGGVEAVTGSKYLIEHDGTSILVDCGLFQGIKENTRRNWDDPSINPEDIDAIVLTHAHIDHTGYIPALLKQGFKGPVYCSRGTFELCSILLIDSGHLQEEDAKRTNIRYEDAKNPKRIEPLYTEQDARRALELFKVVDYQTLIKLGGSLTASLIQSGHIIGSSFVIISDGKKTLTFSGDLGRPHQLIMKPPTHIASTDILVIESTYGDRLHAEEDVVAALGKIINDTVRKGGFVIIPSFAVGRTQEVLYCLYQLKQQNKLPAIPIYLDSPMAIAVTDLFCQFREEMHIEPSVCQAIQQLAVYSRTADDSKAIDASSGSAIIIAGSGMADGGRVIHHLAKFIDDRNNTVVFVGFQAPGTPGRALVDGIKKIQIKGSEHAVHARIESINALSAHADYNEILQWLDHFQQAPEKVFVTHGEPEAAESLKHKMIERFGWNVIIPKYQESFDLD